MLRHMPVCEDMWMCSVCAGVRGTIRPSCRNQQRVCPCVATATDGSRTSHARGRRSTCVCSAVGTHALQIGFYYVTHNVITIPKP